MTPFNRSNSFTSKHGSSASADKSLPKISFGGEILHRRTRLLLIVIVLMLISSVAALFGDSRPRETTLTSPSSYAVFGNSLVSYSLSSSSVTSTTHKATVRVVRQDVYYLFDWKEIDGNIRFLVSLAPMASSHSGHDLAVIDGKSGMTRIGQNVLVARFSPDASRIAYTTSSGMLQVVTATTGEPLASFNEAYDPNWSPDGRKLVFAQAPSLGANSDVLQIVLFDLITGERVELTSGEVDFLPLFHPSGATVLFLSGSRTGIASFWSISSRGGSARQLTNIGATRIDAGFVPTPYRTVTWSPDGTSIAYDRKDSLGLSIWMIQFDPDVERAIAVQRLGEGYIPRWIDSERVLVQTEDESTSILEVVQ